MAGVGVVPNVIVSLRQSEFSGIEGSEVESESLKHWERIAPTLVSDVSASMMKGLYGPGCLRMGAVVSAVFNLTMACSAAGSQVRCLGFLHLNEVRGWAMELNPLKKHWYNVAKPRYLYKSFIVPGWAIQELQSFLPSPWKLPLHWLYSRKTKLWSCGIRNLSPLISSMYAITYLHSMSLSKSFTRH